MIFKSDVGPPSTYYLQGEAVETEFAIVDRFEVRGSKLHAGVLSWLGLSDGMIVENSDVNCCSLTSITINLYLNQLTFLTTRKRFWRMTSSLSVPCRISCPLHRSSPVALLPTISFLCVTRFPSPLFRQKRRRTTMSTMKTTKYPQGDTGKSAVVLDFSRAGPQSTPSPRFSRNSCFAPEEVS